MLMLGGSLMPKPVNIANVSIHSEETLRLTHVNFTLKLTKKAVASSGHRPYATVEVVLAKC